jgi:hypothetical protein
MVYKCTYIYNIYIYIYICVCVCVCVFVCVCVCGSSIQYNTRNKFLEHYIRNVGHAVAQWCWGTALLTGRSRDRFPMVSLELFIDIILPAPLRPGSRLSLLQKWVPGIFLGGKGDRYVGLTILPSSCADCLKIWEPQPPGTLRACHGIALPCFYIRNVLYYKDNRVINNSVVCFNFQLEKVLTFMTEI